MKKLLSILATLTISASSASTVVACGTHTTQNNDNSNDENESPEVAKIRDTSLIGIKSMIISDLFGLNKSETSYQVKRNTPNYKDYVNTFNTDSVNTMIKEGLDQKSLTKPITSLSMGIDLSPIVGLTYGDLQKETFAAFTNFLGYSVLGDNGAFIPIELGEASSNWDQQEKNLELIGKKIADTIVGPLIKNDGFDISKILLSLLPIIEENMGRSFNSFLTFIGLFTINIKKYDQFHEFEPTDKDHSFSKEKTNEEILSNIQKEKITDNDLFKKGEFISTTIEVLQNYLLSINQKQENQIKFIHIITYGEDSLIANVVRVLINIITNVDYQVKFEKNISAVGAGVDIKIDFNLKEIKNTKEIKLGKFLGIPIIGPKEGPMSIKMDNGLYNGLPIVISNVIDRLLTKEIKGSSDFLDVLKELEKRNNGGKIYVWVNAKKGWLGSGGPYDLIEKLEGKVSLAWGFIPENIKSLITGLYANNVFFGDLSNLIDTIVPTDYKDFKKSNDKGRKTKSEELKESWGIDQINISNILTDVPIETLIGKPISIPIPEIQSLFEGTISDSLEATKNWFEDGEYVDITASFNGEEVAKIVEPIMESNTAFKITDIENGYFEGTDTLQYEKYTVMFNPSGIITKDGEKIDSSKKSKYEVWFSRTEEDGKFSYKSIKKII